MKRLFLILSLLFPVVANAQGLRYRDSTAPERGYIEASKQDGYPVTIVGGAGAGGTSATDNSAFTGGSTGVTPMGAIYDNTPPTITDGSVGAPRMNTSRILMVDCQSGCAGAAGDGTATGALAGDGQSVSIALSTYNGAEINFTSGGSLSGTVVAEGSNDGGTSWFSIVFADPRSGAVSTSLASPTSGNYVFVHLGPLSHVRARVSAYTSGTTTANLRTTATRPYSVIFGSDGTDVKPLRMATDGTVRVDPTGTTTQPVSGTVTANAGSGTFFDGIVRDGTGDTTQANVSTGRLHVDGSGVTQPISAASLPLPTGAATSANQDGIIRDGTGDTTQANVSSGRLHVDGSGVTQPVSGTVTANAGSGTFFDGIIRDGTGDTTQANVSSGNLHVNCSNCSGSGVSQQDKTAFTAGTTNMVPVGGYMDDASPSTLAEGEAGAARLTTNRAIHVNLRDASGTELSVGGGTQYDQGTATTDTDKLTMAGAVRRDTAAVATGVADGDRLALSTDSAGRLRTTAADTTQPISGTVTANAGSGTFNIQGNASVNITQVAGAAVSTAASGTMKVGISGATGVAVDGTVAAGSAPTNQIVTGLVYNSTAPAPTTGQTLAVQSDQAGNQRMAPSMAKATLSGWTSATSVNATQDIFTNHGTGAVLVNLVQTSTITGGAITFEVTYDGTNWVTIPADAVLDPASTTFAQISLPYTLQASTNKPFLLMGKGWQGLRIKLSTAITGTATVTPNYALLANEPAKTVVALSPTGANFNVTTQTNASTNVTQFGGTNISTGTGAGGSGIPRVTISNDSSLAANQSVNVAQINGVTPLMGNGASGTGAQRVTIANDSTGIIQPVPGTTGGTSISRTVSGASTNATNVKASAGQVYQVIASNVNAAARYVHLYNTSGTPTCNTSIIATFIVPGNTAGAGTNIQLNPGAAFGTGIGFCITTAVDGTGSVAANDLILNVFYK